MNQRPSMVRLRRVAGTYLPAVRKAALAAARRQRVRAKRRARANAAAYEELLATLEVREPCADAGDPTPSEVAQARTNLQGVQAAATFVEKLSTGAALDAAAAATARDLAIAGRTWAAAAFADALAARPETATAGRLGVAVTAVHRSLPGLAWDEFRGVPAQAWRRHAAVEYLEAAFQQEPATALRVARELVTDRQPELGPAQWYDVLRHAFVAGDLSLARQAYDLLVERADGDPTAWPAADKEIAWLRPWIDCAYAADARPPPDGTVAFALINYRQPSRSKTSQNIGDYIQTLASLGHLVRQQNVRFHGPADLVEFVTEMQQRVRPERRLYTHTGRVQLYSVDRDTSNYQAFPEPTWMLAFGWYMHPLFRLRHDFPMHPNLRPILVSFHCNKREMLTPAAIGYLRRYGPVGCRDWTTVDLLLSLDVPAFFSGCLTTTVDTLFPRLGAVSRARKPHTVYVDVPRGETPEGAHTATQSSRAVKERTFVANLREAVALLERYRSSYTHVVTSRLHCYLPARSLGLEVDFRPKNRADVRFNGLIDVDSDGFEAMWYRLLERLEPVLGAIISGKDEDEVYQLWRELSAADVAAAQARHGAVGPTPVPPFPIHDTCARIAAAATSARPPTTHSPEQEIDIVVVAGRYDHAKLPVVLDSMLAGTSRQLHLWLLTRTFGRAQRQRLAESFPELWISWLPCDDVAYGPAADQPDPAGRDLLLLPDLLVDAARVVVLPPSAVVLGDVAQLAGRDLRGHALAARSSVGTWSSSGFGVFYRAARRLDPRVDVAHDLYRRVHARHVFDFDAFETGVLVLDLDTMRRDRFCTEFLPYAGRFGLTAREVLTFYAGPNRGVIPPRWAHIPSHERVDDPQLIYWVHPATPWRPGYVRNREVWVAASERAARRLRHKPAPVTV